MAVRSTLGGLTATLRSQADNTFQFVLWATFGSAAIHLINIKQAYKERNRILDTRISVLRNLIERVGRGDPHVDIAKELRTGEQRGEDDWEAVIQGIERKLSQREEQSRRVLDEAAAPESVNMRSWWRASLWST
ncbi:hypothetical protein PYCC9005_001481 [Savitreella phatthalungensis]